MPGETESGSCAQLTAYPLPVTKEQNEWPRPFALHAPFEGPNQNDA